MSGRTSYRTHHARRKKPRFSICLSPLSLVTQFSSTQFHLHPSLFHSVDFITSSTDNYSSLDSEDDYRTDSQNVSHQQQFFSELHHDFQWILLLQLQHSNSTLLHTVYIILVFSSLYFIYSLFTLLPTIF